MPPGHCSENSPSDGQKACGEVRPFLLWKPRLTPEQIHAPVRNDREAQTRRVVEFRDGNALAAAAQQTRFADPGDLADIS